MNGFGKFLKIAGVVVGVVAVGIFIGWLASRGVAPEKHVQTGTTPLLSNAITVSPSLGSNGVAVITSNTAAPRRVPLGTNTPTGVLTNWEDRIDNILGSEGEESAKAKEMLALFPQLPPDGQVEVAQHLSNLVLDEQYGPLGALLTDASLSEEVLDVLMGDLLNRPNSIKLPLLVDIARNGQHPKASEAKDLLELFLEEDYGTDWNLWQAKAQEWLQANPD